jgi:type VI secretion system protein ImpA
MASPEVLDFARLLKPIPGEVPAGVDLRADASPTSLYYALKGARDTARDTERRQSVSSPEDGDTPPDWRKVQQTAIQAIAEKSKDLQAAAYLIESLIRLNGFAGLRDGFRLARELIEKFWDGLYPRPDEEGVVTRVAALAGLDAGDSVIVPINRVALTDSNSRGQLAQSHYLQAQGLNKITDAKVRAQKVNDGTIDMAGFQQAVAETPTPFYTALVADLTSCIEEFAKLCTVLDKHCGADAPPSSSIKAALTGCLDLIKEVAKDKLAVASAPAPAPTPAKADGTPAAPPADRLQSRDDAFRMLLKVAEYFRQHEPHTPVSYAIEQAVRWGKMSLPELLTELIPDEAPRKGLFRQIGMKVPEPPGKEAKK